MLHPLIDIFGAYAPAPGFVRADRRLDVAPRSTRSSAQVRAHRALVQALSHRVATSGGDRNTEASVQSRSTACIGRAQRLTLAVREHNAKLPGRSRVAAAVEVSRLTQADPA